MGNFKRKKSKRHIRCTICTPYKWMGNSKDRTKAKYVTYHGGEQS